MALPAGLCSKTGVGESPEGERVTHHPTALIALTHEGAKDA
eukprot:gene3152-1456_t